MAGGHLVCIEGIDGAGKTTLVGALEKTLCAQGLRTTSLHSRSLAQLSLGDADPALRLATLSLQDRAFVAYSRLYSYYLDHVAHQLASFDLVLLDRFKWSYLVRWGCHGLPWGWLTALGSAPGLVPDALHTFYIAASPEQAYLRKLRAGVALTSAELRGKRPGQPDAEAFVQLQTRAIGFYDDLFAHAKPNTVTRIDSALGASAVHDTVAEALRRQCPV